MTPNPSCPLSASAYAFQLPVASCDAPTSLFSGFCLPFYLPSTASLRCSAKAAISSWDIPPSFDLADFVSGCLTRYASQRAVNAALDRILRSAGVMFAAAAFPPNDAHFLNHSRSSGGNLSFSFMLSLYVHLHKIASYIAGKYVLICTDKKSINIF